MEGPWGHGDAPNRSRYETPSNLSQQQRHRYLLFTFVLIGVVAGLLVTGQFAVLALILIACLVYAPRIVEFVTGKK